MGICPAKDMSTSNLPELSKYAADIHNILIEDRDVGYYSSLQDYFLLKEIPLHVYVDLLAKVGATKVEKEVKFDYSYHNGDIWNKKVNEELFKKFIDDLMRLPEVKSAKCGTEDFIAQSKLALIEMYKVMREYVLVNETETSKMEGVSKLYLLAIGILYSKGRGVDKLKFYYDFFKLRFDNRIESLFFDSETENLFRALLFTATYGETAAICKREGVDFWKYIGDNSLESGLSEEAKRMIQYAKRFCIVSKLNNLYLKMVYISFGYKLKELTKDRMMTYDIKVRNGIGWEEFYSLFKEHKIECYFLSSYTIREFIMKNYIVNNQ